MFYSYYIFKGYIKEKNYHKASDRCFSTCISQLCLFLLLFFIFYGLIISAINVMAADFQWVTVEGIASMENNTKQEARRLAIEDARRKAVEEVAGVNIIAESIVIDFSLSGDIIKSVPYGKTLKEKIIKESVDTIFKEGITTPFLIYKVKMRVQVAKETKAPDPYFNLKASLNKSSFKDGDEMELKIKATKACYIYIFNVLEDDKVIRLMPNLNKKDNFLSDDGILILPDKSDKKKGISLIAHLPEGCETAKEIMYILAVKKPFMYDCEQFKDGLFHTYDGQTAFMRDLIEDLVNIPPTDRVEQFIQYRIIR